MRFHMNYAPVNMVIARLRAKSEMVWENRFMRTAVECSLLAHGRLTIVCLGNTTAAVLLFMLPMSDQNVRKLVRL